MKTTKSVKATYLKLVHGLFLSLFLTACASNKLNHGRNTDLLYSKVIKQAVSQYELLSKEALEKNRIPRTLTEEGEYHWTNESFDWTEGFYPGTCWYLYELTQDEKWKSIAQNAQAKFEQHKLRTNNHDLGFIFNCSYGNGYRIIQSPDFKKVMIEAGNSLITRFNPTIGCIQSWDVVGGWQSKRNWKFPVIIDNMMNLELLFEISKLTGDPKYRDVAIRHANTTLKNHFREDNSSFHVIDYDPETGEVRKKETAQGNKNESSWARGQAWGLYGFTVCYRYTRNPEYLKQAERIARFINNDNRIPKDRVPYWDYDAPAIPNEPRDASAAAITASALVELSQYTNGAYLGIADVIIQSLASPEYFAAIGENKYFLLKHSVGSIPHNNEIDVPLNYADYYFIEAIKKRMEFNVER